MYSFRLDSYMQNKSEHKLNTAYQHSKIKTINIGDNAESSMAIPQFRKPKKVVKLLHYKAGQFFESKHVIEEMKLWASELENSKKLKSQFNTKSSSRIIANNDKEKTFGVYNKMRQNQHLARELPVTWKRFQQKDYFEGIQIDFEEVERIRFKSQIKKMPVQPLQFPEPSRQPRQGPASFRPFMTRFPEKILSKTRLLTPKSIQSNNSTNHVHSTFSDMNGRSVSVKSTKIQGRKLHKSAKNLLHSQTTRNYYKSKSKMKRMWQTVGLNEWTNRSTHT